MLFNINNQFNWRIQLKSWKVSIIQKWRVRISIMTQAAHTSQLVQLFLVKPNISQVQFARYYSTIHFSIPKIWTLLGKKKKWGCWWDSKEFDETAIRYFKRWLQKVFWIVETAMGQVCDLGEDFFEDD